jgi:hypothetical protein
MYTMIVRRLRLDDGHQHSPWVYQSEMGMDGVDRLTWQLARRGLVRANQVQCTVDFAPQKYAAHST